MDKGFRTHCSVLDQVQSHVLVIEVGVESCVGGGRGRSRWSRVTSRTPRMALGDGWLCGLGLGLIQKQGKRENRSIHTRAHTVGIGLVVDIYKQFLCPTLETCTVLVPHMLYQPHTESTYIHVSLYKQAQNDAGNIFANDNAVQRQIHVRVIHAESSGTLAILPTVMSSSDG